MSDIQLAGPDGKPLEKPVARPMPDRKQKFDMCFIMVTLMTREERRQFKKMLRPLVRKLDLFYPNGMSEGDIKRDIEKAAVSIVPNGANDAESQVAEVGAQPSVSAQPEGDSDGEEVAAPGEEGGC